MIANAAIVFIPVIFSRFRVDELGLFDVVIVACDGSGIDNAAVSSVIIEDEANLKELI